VNRRDPAKKAVTEVVADYDLGGGAIKRAIINIRSLKAKVVENAVVEEAGAEVQGDGFPAAPPALPIPATAVEVPAPPTVEVEAPRPPVPAPPTAEVEAPRSPAEVAEAPPYRPVEHPGFMVDCHGEKWFEDYDATMRDINGPYHYRSWSLKTPTDTTWIEGYNVDKKISRLDVFLMMFPPKQLTSIVTYTNVELEDLNKRRTTKSEILKFFGFVVLCTKYEFSSRACLWSETSPTKYEKAAAFGRFGMARMRFDDLWRCIRFGDQPRIRPVGMSPERYRWLLIDEFIDNFNEHRAKTFLPSELICVDESISRWYGQGGEWINHGLPMYVAMDRKPENGCEIQNAACGRSGVMIRLKIVKTATEAEALGANEDDNGLLHGTKVLKELIQPWAFTNRMVCADSYFASVGTAEELLKLRTRFIGVVKTATRRFPMQLLSTKELHQRGDRYGLVSKNADGIPYLLSFVWMDRDRRYFIASGSSLSDGTPIVRTRWRQVGDDPESDPTRVELTIAQPKAAEVYYSACSKIDQHNRDRQDTLMLERKLVTNDWSTRVNLSILAIILVDSWRVYNKMTFPDEIGRLKEIQKDFYGHLAAELIDNKYDHIGSRRQHAAGSPDGSFDSNLIDNRTGEPRSGIDAHLSPTKRRRKNKWGRETANTFQGRCTVCRSKTIYQCSVCIDSQPNCDKAWLCHTKSGKLCFPQHMSDKHSPE
jgi:hypothetical protein